MKLETLNAQNNCKLYRLTIDESVKNEVYGFNEDLGTKVGHGIERKIDQEEIDKLNHLLSVGPRVYRSVVEEVAGLPITIETYPLYAFVSEKISGCRMIGEKFSLYTANFAVNYNDPKNILSIEGYDTVNVDATLGDPRNLYIYQYVAGHLPRQRQPLVLGIPESLTKIYPDACEMLQPMIAEPYRIDENTTFEKIYNDAKNSLGENFQNFIERLHPTHYSTPYSLTSQDWQWINENIQRDIATVRAVLSLASDVEKGLNFECKKAIEANILLNVSTVISDENFRYIIDTDDMDIKVCALTRISNDQQFRELFNDWYPNIEFVDNPFTFTALGKAYNKGIYSKEEFDKDYPYLYSIVSKRLSVMEDVDDTSVKKSDCEYLVKYFMNIDGITDEDEHLDTIISRIFIK